MDRVLVIIVTYNAHGWIRQCIDSVDRQCYDVLVVDNASGDDTVGIIRTAYPDVRLFLQTENLGFGKANNIGLRYAVDNAYDYVLLLNQDAWLLPDTIEKLIIAHKQQPQYWILSPMQMNTERGGLERHFEHFAASCLLDNASVVSVPFVNAALWLLPVSCVKTVGGFDPLFPHYGEDNDYVNRVHYFGGEVGIVQDAIAYHEHSQVPASFSEQQEVYRMMLVFLGVWKDLTKSDMAGKSAARYLYCRKMLRSLLLRKKHDLVNYHTAWVMAKNQSVAINQHRQLSRKEGAFL